MGLRESVLVSLGAIRSNPILLHEGSRDDTDVRPLVFWLELTGK